MALIIGCGVSQSSDLNLDLVIPTNQDVFDGAELLRVTAIAGDNKERTETSIVDGVPQEVEVPGVTLGGSIRVIIEALGPETAPGVRPVVSRGRSIPVELGGGKNATLKVFFGRVGEFGTIGQMAVARAGHAAVPLPDGRVLFAGGFTGTQTMEASAELFNPRTGQLETTGGMFLENAHQVPTALGDGRVLLSGGEADIADSVGHLAIFQTDPDGFSSLVGTGAAPRVNHAAAPIPGGSLQVGGGYFSAGSLVMLSDNAQAYLPNESPPIQQVAGPTARAYGTATALHDGRVLLFGGLRVDETFPSTVPGGIDWVVPEIYDHADKTTTPLTGFALELRYAHTSVAAPSGSVVIMGGYDADTIGTVETPLSFVALFDPDATSFSRIASLQRARASAPGVVLEDGRVLLVGGVSFAPQPSTSCEQGGGGGQNVPYVPVNTAETYDLSAGSALTAGCLAEPRVGHSVTPLPDGSILVAGGWTRYDDAGIAQDPTPLIEIYIPE